jgi:hypothetical protein
MFSAADALQAAIWRNINVFQHKHASLIWSVTSLLFAVKGQKTANAWLFLCRLNLQKAGVSAAESSSPLFFCCK